MRAITAFILILLVTVQSFSRMIILLQFELNRDYIARSLCINRSKPVMHCGGKCQLAKKMQQENKGESPAGPNWGKSKPVEMIPAGLSKLFLAIPDDTITYFGYRQQEKPPVYLSPVFRPPCC